MLKLVIIVLFQDTVLIVTNVTQSLMKVVQIPSIQVLYNLENVQLQLQKLFASNE